MWPPPLSTIALLDRCIAKGIKLNKDKFRFCVPEVLFMGHRLTSRGLAVDENKVHAIDDMPPPTDIKGVQRLLSMAAYLAKFVPQFSEITGPIRSLLDKDAECLSTPKRQTLLVRLSFPTLPTLSSYASEV